MMRLGGSMFVAVLERVFESFAGLELWHGNGRDLDLFGWVLWIDAHTRGASFGHKCTKSSNCDFTSVLKRRSDDFYQSFDDFFGLLFGDVVDTFRKSGDEFGFVHMRR